MRARVRVRARVCVRARVLSFSSIARTDPPDGGRRDVDDVDDGTGER